MKKWNLVIDVAECHNCQNCVIACKDEYVGNAFEGYAAPQPLHGHEWIRILAVERGCAPIVDAAYLPTMCGHCDDAPCVAAGGGAVVKRVDGIVLIDPQLARGRRDLVDACPYGAVWWNDELQLPQAWPFDAHLLDSGWEQPRCAQACPTGAIKALRISDEEMNAIRLRDGLETLGSRDGARPRVFYRNLHRYSSLFVAGVVAERDGDRIECAVDVEVALLRGESVAANARTDAFGEFKFDGLARDSGAYRVRVGGTLLVDVVLEGVSVVIGNIELGSAATTASARGSPEGQPSR